MRPNVPDRGRWRSAEMNGAAAPRPNPKSTPHEREPACTDACLRVRVAPCACGERIPIHNGRGITRWNTGLAHARWLSRGHQPAATTQLKARAGGTAAPTAAAYHIHRGRACAAQAGAKTRHARTPCRARSAAAPARQSASRARRQAARPPSPPAPERARARAAAAARRGAAGAVGQGPHVARRLRLHQPLRTVRAHLRRSGGGARRRVERRARVLRERSKRVLSFAGLQLRRTQA